MKLLKSILLFLISIITIVIFYWVYAWLSFSLSSDSPLTLIDIKQSNKRKDFSLALFYFPSNATNQKSIQLFKVYNNGKNELLRNFDRYNYGKILLYQDSVKIRLIDSVNERIYLQDTLTLKLEE